MFCPVLHAGEMESTGPVTRYALSLLSGEPSQCIVAALAVELGGVVVYHAVVVKLAGFPKLSVRLTTEPNGMVVKFGLAVPLSPPKIVGNAPGTSPKSAWFEYVTAALGPTPSSWKR